MFVDFQEGIMTHAIRIYQPGGPEALRWESVAVGLPQKGEVKLKQTAVGLNYIDVYHRSGVYPLPMPATIGSEGVGIVEQIGPSVTEVKIGDRVAYAGPPYGAYAETRLMPANRLVKLPDSITDVQAASMMLQGLTAWYLLRKTHPVKTGDTILVHAAAGGVGLLLCQWARHLGVTVIGTVSSDSKAELARTNGATYTVVYTREDFVERVRELTNGEKTSVVYDGVGKDTFLKSLDCLAPCGLMVLFGNASGMVPPFNLNILLEKGALFVTRPTLSIYTAKRENLLAGAKELFEVVQSGAVKIHVNQTFPLQEAAQAHRDLEARKTTGKTVFTV